MHLLDSLELFHSLGLNCLAFDYRGYGDSSGRPTEAGTYLDAQAAYDWLTGAKGIPPEQIILFGRSLGGSIAAHLAGRVQAAGSGNRECVHLLRGCRRRFLPVSAGPAVRSLSVSLRHTGLRQKGPLPGDGGAQPGR